MKALKEQLLFTLKPNYKIKTVFIGGGTPSTIKADEYRTIFEIISGYMKQDCQISIEANPNSATKKWIKDIYNLGVNRISFGVQSFNQEKLQFLGRNHTKLDAIEAIQYAKEVGFEHINCDIIYDTAIDTKELLLDDLDIVQNLPIDHISAYSLTIEEGTKFFNTSNTKVENQILTQMIFDKLNSFGFTQYEISNFAKSKDAISKHNLGYWQYDEYLGIGSGAVGCLDNQRLYTQKDIVKYISNPTQYSEIENLTSYDIKMEKVLLALRSIVGFDIDILNQNEQQKVQLLVDEHKLSLKDNRVYCDNFLLADELALYILE
jgi:oxygen-independent coproporphyrinogen-3 oxidase